MTFDETYLARFSLKGFEPIKGARARNEKLKALSANSEYAEVLEEMRNLKQFALLLNRSKGVFSTLSILPSILPATPEETQRPLRTLIQ